MARLHHAFSHLLPILDDPEYPLPLANSTCILDVPAEELNTTFLHDILNDANRVLLDDLPSPAPVLSDDEDYSDSDSSVVLSALAFHTGRLRGQQCSYNGYINSLNKSRPDGHRYWECKDRKQHTLACKGRLITLGDSTVTKENPHCHPPSLKDIGVEQFLSEIRTDNSRETAVNVYQGLLLNTPSSVKSALHNIKKQINDFRRKTRGHPASSATSARQKLLKGPLSGPDHSDGGLYLLEDVTTSCGKRIVRDSVIRDPGW